MIVVATGEYCDSGVEGVPSITINQALPKVKLSNKRNQKSVFGVITNYSNNERLDNINYDHNPQFETGLNGKIRINSVGEGAIWVCNINGNFENGDYITTCEVPGIGIKQLDNVLRNYTVAKITCDCNFDLNSDKYICEEFEFNGEIYRKAFVDCTYHCG